MKLLYTTLVFGFVFTVTCSVFNATVHAERAHHDVLATAVASN